MNIECWEPNCDSQVRWRYVSPDTHIYHFCNEHCKWHMSFEYKGELEMFTGNVPEKFQPSSSGALKAM